MAKKINDYNKISEKETEETKDTVKWEKGSPQDRIEEFRSKPWIEGEMKFLKERLVKDKEILAQHKKIVWTADNLVDDKVKEKLTEKDYKTIEQARRVVQQTQEQIDITNAVLNLYEGFLKNLE